MRFALFLGCNIPARLPQYETAARAVLDRLSVALETVDGFNCCGYPARNLDRLAYLASAARNLALAEAAGLELMALCKCCYGSLKAAQAALAADENLRRRVAALLEGEGLRYRGTAVVEHLLTVVHRRVGLERLRAEVTHGYEGLKVAVSYGCHALRPSRVTGFDDPVHPRLFDELVEITGAFSVEWDRKLACCGAPLTGIDDRLAAEMTRRKIDSARRAGADVICTACPWTHLQFDWFDQYENGRGQADEPLPAVLYPQLAGLAMGIGADALGLSANRIEARHIASYRITE